MTARERHLQREVDRMQRELRVARRGIAIIRPHLFADDGTEDGTTGVAAGSRPLKIIGHTGLYGGCYEITAGVWKSPLSLTGGGKLDLSTLTNFAQGSAGYLVNVAEDGWDTWRLPDQAIVCGAVLQIDKVDGKFDLYTVNSNRAVRGVRWNAQKRAIEITYSQQPPDTLLDADWEIAVQFATCPGTNAAEFNSY